MPNRSAFRKRNPLEPEKRPLRLFEIARVLVRFDHVASVIVNANHGIMRTAIKLRVSNCVRVFRVPQATEWQRIVKPLQNATLLDASYPDRRSTVV